MLIYISANLYTFPTIVGNVYKLIFRQYLDVIRLIKSLDLI